MGFQFNPITGQLDLVNKSGSGPRFDYFLEALSSYDRIASITYADSGLRTQRATSIVYTSAEFPSSDITKTIFYLDVGSINQRIDKIEIAGSVFLPDSFRKVFQYSLSGIRYKQTGFYYELF